MTAKLTEQQQQFALNIVARWMGDEYGHGQPFPTGEQAAYRGLGPVLRPEYDGIWDTIPPTPTIILEGLPGACWAYDAQHELEAALHDIGVRGVPLAGFALSLVPDIE